MSSSRLRLAFPIVELRLGAEHRLVAVALRPDPDLAAVWVVHDGQRRLRREEDDADRLSRLVDHLMRSGRALREHGDVAGLERLLSVRRAQRRLARDDQQPLLTALLVVVRPRLLAGRELVQAAAQKVGAETFPEGRRAVPVALAIVLAVPVAAVHIERLHEDDFRTRAPPMA